MASLDKSNVVNGNTISASDISALYDAFTGTTTYDNIDFTGTSSRANTLLSTGVGANINYAVPFINTASSNYSSFLYDTNDQILYNPSTNLLTVTSSFAVTSSYAITSEPPTQVLIATSPDSVNPAGAAPWFPFGGVLDTSQTAFVDLQQIFGFTPNGGFGIDIIVTANEIAPSGGSSGVAVSPFIDFAGIANRLYFAGNSGSGALVVYQGWYRV